MANRTRHDAERMAQERRVIEAWYYAQTQQDLDLDARLTPDQRLDHDALRAIIDRLRHRDLVALESIFDRISGPPRSS